MDDPVAGGPPLRLPSGGLLASTRRSPPVDPNGSASGCCDLQRVLGRRPGGTYAHLVMRDEADDPEVTVDTLGQPCPIPVIELAKAVRDAEVGAVVAVLSDDPASKVDIPVWCRMQRHGFLRRDDLEEGGWRYTVEKLRDGR